MVPNPRIAPRVNNVQGRKRIQGHSRIIITLGLSLFCTDRLLRLAFALCIAIKGAMRFSPMEIQSKQLQVVLFGSNGDVSTILTWHAIAQVFLSSRISRFADYRFTIICS